MKEETLELTASIEVADDIEKKIRTVGVKNLDFEKAKELGLFTRISNLLCVSHASIMAAYRVYGGVDYLLQMFGGRKNEIAREMNAYEKAYDRFIKFWTLYYAHAQAGLEVNDESETLFRNIMKWSQIPISWELGDAQRVNDDTDVAIRFKAENDKEYTFRKSTLNEEIIDSHESWCITKFDTKNNTQICIEDEMDKASAMMVAKRLSAEDPDNFYTACLVQDVTKKETIVTPIKAYCGNETIGKITKTLK